MKYNCDHCNYETGIKSNFTRHEKSVAHCQKIKLLSLELSSKKKNHKCKCGAAFSHKSGLSRHGKSCNKLDEVQELKEQVAALVETNNDVTALLKEILNNNVILSSNQTINNYNVSIKNYVQSNYPNAPALIAPADYAKLKYKNQDLDDALLYHHENKSLHKFLGDFIVNYYKKDKPEDQSVWASDVSRLTYVIKESLAEKKSIWNSDPKGLKTKKMIIQPMLDHINKCLDDYWDNQVNDDKYFKKGNRQIDVDSLNKRQNRLNRVYEIRNDIETGVLANEIIKHIASYLHLDEKVKDSGIKDNVKKNKKIIIDKGLFHDSSEENIED